MTQNERTVLSRALSTLDSTLVDLHVYSHMRTPILNGGEVDLYNYRALGKIILARRMLSELLGRTFDYLLPGEYCDEDTNLEDLNAYTPSPRSGYDEPLNDDEKRWLMKRLLVVLDGIIGVQDSDDACLRCVRREVAEVAGYPELSHYRLMLEDTVEPKFFKDYEVHVDFK